MGKKPDEAVLDRAVSALGTKLGVLNKEESMGTKKIAEDVKSRSMQVATDAGDYVSQDQAVGDQAAETRQPGAPSEPNMRGSQVQSVRPENDGSYSLTANKEGISVLKTLAQGNLQAIQANNRMIQILAQDPAAGAPAQDPGNQGGDEPAEGQALGGEPAPGTDAGAAAEPPAAVGAPATPTDMAIQQKIEELEDTINVNKEVVKTLQEVSQQAGVPTMAGRRQASRQVQAGIIGNALGGIFNGMVTEPLKNLAKDIGAAGAATLKSVEDMAAYVQNNYTKKGLSDKDAQALIAGIRAQKDPAAAMQQLTALGQGQGAAPAAAPATASRQVTARGPFPYGINPPGWVPTDLVDFWREAVERAVEEEGEDPNDPNIYRKITFIYKALVKKHGGPDVPVSLPHSDPRSTGGRNRERKTRDIAREFKRYPGDSGAESGFGGVDPNSPYGLPSEASRRQAASVGTPRENEPNPKVPHSWLDVADMTISDDPDKSLASEAKGKSDGTPKAKMPQTFGDGADTDYVLAAKTVLKRHASLLKKRGASTAKIDRVINKSGLALQAKKVIALRQKLAGEKKSMYAEIKNLMTSGKTFEAALKAVMDGNPVYKAAFPRFKMALRTLSVMTKRAEGEDPNRLDPGPSLRTPEYSGDDTGDRKPDAISDGSDTTLVSPETSKVERAADANLDAEHREDIAGSTVASKGFSREEQKKILGVLERLDTAHDSLETLTGSWAKKSVLASTPRALESSFASRLTGMKTIGDSIEKMLTAANKCIASGKNLREEMAKAIKLAKQEIRATTDILKTAQILGMEADSRAQRLNRVGPAMKLALQMHAKGHMRVDELPAKIASFVGMSASEFEKVAETVSSIQPATKTAANRSGFAQHLPLVRTSSSEVDPLAGIFED